MKTTANAKLLKPETFDLYSMSPVLTNIDTINKNLAALGSNKTYSATAITADILTPYANAAIHSQTLYQYGAWNYIDVTISRTVATSLGTGGRLYANIGYLNPEYVPVTSQPLYSGLGTNRGATAVIGNDSTPRLYLTGVTGNTALAANEQIRLTGWYLAHDEAKGAQSVGIQSPSVLGKMDYSVMNTAYGVMDAQCSKLQSNRAVSTTDIALTLDATGADMDVSVKNIKKLGEWIYIDIRASVKADTTITATGQLANIKLIGNISDLDLRPERITPLVNGNAGRTAHGYVRTDGNLYLNAVATTNATSGGTSTLATTETVQICGLYRVKMGI